MGFELFIAHRIYKGKTGTQRFSRPAVRIAIAGIAVGLLVMIVSLAVVRGFKREVSDKVVGFGSHAQILSLTQTQDYIICPVVTDDSLLQVVKSTPGVASMQLFATKQGMLKTDSVFCGIELKGVGEDYDLSFFRRYLVDGSVPNFSAKQSSNNILISRSIADDLGLKIGDRVFAYFFSNQSVRARRFTVVGIYETHLSQYDKVVCLTDLRTVRRLNNWESDESSGIEIRVKDFSKLDEVVNCLVTRVNHAPDRIGALRGAFSIRDIVPSIFAWLDVLDTNVIMILVLMMLIGCFTVVSGLLIVMLERIQMIGILKSLGATNSQIRGIFRRFGILLVGRALLLGDVLSVVVCYLQKSFGLIKLDANTYYIDTVPIEFDWSSLVYVNMGVLLISSFVIFGTSFFISMQGPANTIRWE